MKKTIAEILHKILDPQFWIHLIKSIPKALRSIYMSFSFLLLLIMFLFAKIYHVFELIPLLGLPFKALGHVWKNYLHRYYEVLVEDIEKVRTTELRRSYLISLAFKNLMVKKTRSFITILGMSVGVGIIVLLLSLGYGLERLIISRVAGLDELKIIDVSTGENTSLRLNGDALKRIQKLPRVEKAIPFISLVGRVSYNKANTDTLVYSVSKEYLELNKVKMIKGKYFATNVLPDKMTMGQVAGVEDEIRQSVWGEQIREVDFNILPETDSIAWESCSVNSKILGYVPRIEGGYTGQEVWGGEYTPFEAKGRSGYDRKNSMFTGLWVRTRTPLFDKNIEGTLVPVLDDQGRHIWEDVCLQEKDLAVTTSLQFAEVLGESTDSATLDEEVVASDSAETSTYDSVVIATSSGGLEVVTLQSSSDSAAVTKKKTETLNLTSPLSGEAVVSLGFLRLLNIPENQAVGKKFKVQFIIVKNLMPEVEGRMLTNQVEYTIKGVADDEDNQYMYIPFADAQTIGIQNYSQVKVLFTDKDRMPKARKEIETMGFKTNSTADTVAQIETLFANLRVLLGLLGMVALGVASLGMFNTLTVSLLERTREIGGMKTMGVVSDEIQDLFLAEAMIMGLGGGIGGLLLGYLIGQALSLGISLIAMVNGQGYLQLTYIPVFLSVFILLASFVVGMLTGLYPAQRAKRISALNALRYE